MHISYFFAGKLEKFEIPKRAKLCTEQWLPENELVTAAFKLKRKNLQSFYQTDISALYRDWVTFLLQGVNASQFFWWLHMKSKSYFNGQECFYLIQMLLPCPVIELANWLVKKSASTTRR